MKARGPGATMLRSAAVLMSVLATTWLLIGPFDYAARPYSNVLRAGGDALLKPVGGDFATRLRPHVSKPGQRVKQGDTDILFRVRNGPHLGNTTIDLRRLGYRPWVLLMTLIGFTLVPWRRKLWASLWGTLLVHAFIAVRISVRVLLGWFTVGQRPGIELSPWFQDPDHEAALQAWMQMEREAFLWLIATLAIWVLVCFRSADWERWFWSRSAQSSEDSETKAN